MKKILPVLLLIVVSLPAGAQEPLLYTGWNFENLNGNVQLMSTSTGKEIRFDESGQIVKLTDRYFSYEHTYSDPFHYNDGYADYEVTFPKDYMRLEEGNYEQCVYRFDTLGRIDNYSIEAEHWNLQVSYSYGGDEDRFPSVMILKYDSEVGEWQEERSFQYWSFDHYGNWVQRHITGVIYDPYTGTEKFQQNEYAVYAYREPETSGADTPPDFFGLEQEMYERVIGTEYPGVFRSGLSFSDGLTMFLFIPKDEPETWEKRELEKMTVVRDDDKYDVLVERLNEMSYKELSGQFYIYVWHVPAKYLLYFPTGDQPYMPDMRAPWEEAVYRLDYDSGEIIPAGNFDIEYNGTRQTPMYRWLEEFLDNHPAR
ncbi:MAG: hypothetical protein LUF87_09385 [Alistipes sp.]|nr:hypothetical protein [Alistipes sp.]